jgi:hypothetical protein
MEHEDFRQEPPEGMAAAAYLVCAFVGAGILLLACMAANKLGWL